MRSFALSLSAVLFLAAPVLAQSTAPVREAGATTRPADATARLPVEVRTLLGTVRPLGHGTLRWFGLRVYDATLWSADSTFAPDRAFALELRYSRDIPRERLLNSTVSEMRRLGQSDDAKVARWRELLVPIFPDVREGDRLVGVHLPGRGAAFFDAQRRIGVVEDAEFARWFFAIWLDAGTREPSLRAALLGTP